MIAMVDRDWRWLCRKVGAAPARVYGAQLPCLAAACIFFRMRQFMRAGALFLASGIVAGFGAAPEPRLHLVGDSTMADKPKEPPNPETGWGQVLPQFFVDPTRIVNHAVNGRSTRSFIAEGKWQAVVDSLRAGDWVIIQFGHNDSKEDDSTRYAAPRGAFQENLRRMVRDARAHGATPLFATPVARRRWNEKGEFYDVHGDYPDAMRDVAAAEGVRVLEMHRLTMDLVRAHGEEGSKRLFLHYPAGQFARKPEGYMDDTHFSEYGAWRVASIAVQEIIRLGLPLAEWLKH